MQCAASRSLMSRTTSNLQCDSLILPFLPPLPLLSFVPPSLPPLPLLSFVPPSPSSPFFCSSLVPPLPLLSFVPPSLPFLSSPFFCSSLLPLPSSSSPLLSFVPPSFFLLYISFQQNVIVLTSISREIVFVNVTTVT